MLIRLTCASILSLGIFKLSYIKNVFKTIPSPIYFYINQPYEDFPKIKFKENQNNSNIYKFLEHFH